MNQVEALARKIGFGFRPDEEVPTDPVQWIDDQLQLPRSFQGISSLSDPGRTGEWPLKFLKNVKERTDLYFDYWEMYKSVRADNSLDAGSRKSKVNQWLDDNVPFRHDETRFYHRAIYARDQVRQRLLHFWINHLYVSGEKHDLMMFADHIERAIESGLDGSFEDLLYNSTTSPQMLRYLDNQESIGAKSKRAESARKKNQYVGLNDNLARELMELHSVSPAMGYTEDDIHNVARILSGWGIQSSRNDQKKVKDRAHPYIADRGEKGTISVFGLKLGSQFGTNEKALKPLIKYLAEHPMTAKHLSTKLCQHFISDDPPAEDIEAVEGVWLSSKGNLSKVHKELMNRVLASLEQQKKVLWPITWYMQSARISGASVIEGWDDVGKPNTRPFQSDAFGISRELGQGFWLLNRQPNGFSIAGQDWVSPSHLERRIKLAALVGLYGRPLAVPSDVRGRLGFKTTQTEFGDVRDWVMLLCGSQFMEV